jgi:thiamine biosynthesis lipoprotein
LNKFLLLIIIACFGFITASGQFKKYTYYADKMGSPLKIIIGTEANQIDSVQSTQLAQETFQLIDSLNHILSDYDKTSELSSINEHAGKGLQPISPILQEILVIAQKAYYQTKGAYNIAIGPLSILWRNARQSKLFPHASQIKAAQELIQFDQIKIDTIHHLIDIPTIGMRLDLGSLGKGFVAQKALNYLKSKGVVYAMIDAGGKIVTLSPKNQFWTIGINQIRDKNKAINKTLKLSNHAVATSGDAYQFFIYKGHRYSHIISPLTGYGIEIPKNITVIARDGTTADLLSTACSILSVKEALALVKKYDAAILIAVQKDKYIQYYSSKNFNAFLN